jgi:nicotinamidase-related amidase
MIRAAITLRRKRILVDVDIQRDLFLADGKACVRNHRRVLANIRRVLAWARRNRIRQISTILLKDPNHSNGQYCVAGTLGAKKLSYTMRNRHISFDADNSTDFLKELLGNYDQIILAKQEDDPFGQPRADRILSETKATEFIVIGGLAETTVKATVLGLLVRRRAVTVLTDTIGHHDKNVAEIALRQMQAKGAKLIDSKGLLGHSHLLVVHACRCDRCRGRLQKTCAAAACDDEA